MSQGISFGGLGSGLDTGSIIDQLMSIERRPVQLMQRQQARLELQRETLKGINSSLLTLNGSVKKLADNDLFSIVQASSEDEDKVTVNATNEAAAGTFSVEIQALAQARSLSSRTFSSLDSGLGLSGEFVVNGKGVAVAADDNLVDIREAINRSQAGVTAQILTVTEGDNRLILTAEQVGRDGFSIKDASSTNLLQGLGFTSGETQIKKGFANGGRSDHFLAEDQAIGTLLGLGSPPAGTVTVGNQEIELDLGVDSLSGIRDKINAAAPAGVSAAIVTSDDGGLTRYRLEVEGTTNLVDSSGALETLGLINASGAIANEIVTGAESDSFSSTTTAVGTMLGLSAASASTVTIGGTAVTIDLSTDSLTDIQTKINDATAGAAVTTIINSADDAGNTQFRLRIEGAADFGDDNNALEALGILQGSNSSFESVAQVLTGSGTNLALGAVRHDTGSGAKSDTFSSDTDALGGMVGSSASGTIRVGDQDINVDLANDSLADVRDKINAAAPSGVTASINAVGPSSFELVINGTTEFDDPAGVLQAMGVLESATTATGDTRFGEMIGANVAVGDTISISGTNRDGGQVSGTFNISSDNLKIDSLLNTVEQLFGGQVTAGVDASGRIEVRDNQPGASQLEVTLQANNEGGGNLDFGTLTQTTEGRNARSSELQAGQDAQFRINGIDLTRSTNSVDDAVQGVTLELKEAEAGKLVNISVSKDDTSELRTNIEAFVTDFNAAMALIDEQYVVDEQTQQAGVLAGDSTLLSLQSRLRSIVTNQIGALSGGFDALVLVGVNFDRAGVLSIDQDRLTEALSENLEAVRRLFVAEGTSTNSNQLEFVNSNRNTLPGNYSVSIEQAAARAKAAGQSELIGGLAQDQTLTITDKASGRSATIAFDAGNTLEEIVSKINADLASDVAEVRRATIANTTDGTAPITTATTFAEIFGAGVQAQDSIRIIGSNHDGVQVEGQFDIADPASTTVGNLLDTVRSTFNNEISASVDSQGRILVSDNQVGDSSLAVALVEGNEGGGSLDFGSIEVEVEGRLPIEVIASNVNGRLSLEHNAYGERNGFSLSQSLDQFGLVEGDYDGADVGGTINGEEADGFGRILTGKLDNSNTAGLAVRGFADGRGVSQRRS